MSITSVDSSPLHVKPQIDLNLATEANRILFVLNKLIERIEFVGLLHFFVEDDGVLLQNIFSGEICAEIDKKCERFKIDRFRRRSMRPQRGSTETQWTTKSLEANVNDGFDADEDDEDKDSVDSELHNIEPQLLRQKTKLKRKYDELAEVINLLEENQKVKLKAEELKPQLPSSTRFLLKKLILFKEFMEKRLAQNATEYKAKMRYMKETYERNERVKKEIERMEEQLVVTKTDANVCLIGRNILIKRHQNKIEKVKAQSQEAIERRMNESEKEMVNNWKESTAKQEKLKSDLLEASEKYSSLLKEHLATEKALRGKRSKIENQVLGWIQKYDQDYGEKHAEEEEIQSRLDKEMEEVNEIQRKLDEQEEEYDELMQEKAEYEEEMLERRLYQFIMNRSARRIQRGYRMYKARKLAKKLAKKGKKGKKKK